MKRPRGTGVWISDDMSDLTVKFALSSGVLLLVAGVLLGWWMTWAIERATLDAAAENVGLYVERLIAPILERRLENGVLDAPRFERLDTLVRSPEFARQVKTFKLWAAGGRLAYDSSGKRIGMQFPVEGPLADAWAGRARAVASWSREEVRPEHRPREGPYIEVYSPVRLPRSGEIRAVAEFYHDGASLRRRLRHVWLVTASLLGGVLLVIWLGLSGLVRAGSRTIRTQRHTLDQQVQALSRAIEENERLQRRVRRATLATAELNESALQRLGAELHDGPAQAVGYVLLRFRRLLERIEGREGTSPVSSGRLSGKVPDKDASTDLPDEVGGLYETLSEALSEIRALARGLMLPELKDKTFEEVVRGAVQSHRRRTRSEVVLHLELSDNVRAAGAACPEVPVKLTVYRVIQETLTNAFRHAGGRGQRVLAQIGDGMITLEICDEGPGIAEPAAGAATNRLGLQGLRRRIESLGGRFYVEPRVPHGTRVTAHVPYSVGGGNREEEAA